MKRHFFVILGLTLLFMHCGGTYVGDRPGGSLYVIVQEEIQNCHAANAYEAVATLRPTLIDYDERHAGGMNSMASAKVRVNDAPAGGKDAMRGINVTEIEQIEYLRPNEAVLRYGALYNGGVFLITTR